MNILNCCTSNLFYNFMIVIMKMQKLVYKMLCCKLNIQMKDYIIHIRNNNINSRTLYNLLISYTNTSEIHWKNT
jgi:hypothetical protein